MPHFRFQLEFTDEFVADSDSFVDRVMTDYETIDEGKN